MNSDSRRTDAEDNLNPPHPATVVEPVERKKTIAGAKGAYELEEQPFATGNNAEVFKAKDTDTDTIRACKVINLRRPSFTDEERDNIDREINILCLMQHVRFLNGVHFVRKKSREKVACVPHTIFCFLFLPSGEHHRLCRPIPYTGPNLYLFRARPRHDTC